GTSVLGLLVDQLTGVVPVVLVARRERDRRHNWYLSVGGGVHLVTGELLSGSLAAMAHLRVMRRDDLAHPTPPAHPRDIVIADLKLLPDDLPQKPRPLHDRIHTDQLLA